MTVGDLPERLEGEARNPDHYSDNRPLTAARLLRDAAARIRSLEGENAGLTERAILDQRRESERCGGGQAVSGPANLGSAPPSDPPIYDERDRTTILRALKNTEAEVSRLKLSLGDWINATTTATAERNMARARAESAEASLAKAVEGLEPFANVIPKAIPSEAYDAMGLSPDAFTRAYQARQAILSTIRQEPKG